VCSFAFTSFGSWVISSNAISPKNKKKIKKKIKKIKNQIEKLPFFGFYNKLNIKNPPKRRLNFMSPFLLIISPLHLL